MLNFSFIKEVCYLNYAKRPWFIIKPLFFLFLENQNLSFFSIKRKKKARLITSKIKRYQLCQIEDLIIVLEEFLSWDAHVNTWCKRLAQTNVVLPKLHYNVPPKIGVSVYFSFFLSFVRVLSTVVWFEIYLKNQF